MAQIQLSDFIAQYSGKITGNTPDNTGQCVGLVAKWIELLGLPHVWGNAKDLLANSDPAYFDIIKKDPSTCPVPGDVFVYGDTWGNGYGHTGVVVSADAVNVTLFEQNFTPGATPAVRTHQYNGALGWLRPKASFTVGEVTSTYYKGLDLTNVESMKVAIDTWDRVKNGELVDKAQYQSQADAATQCQTQLKTALDQVTEFQRKEAELEGALTSIKAQLKEVQSKYEDEQKLVLSLKAEIEEIHKQDKDFGQEALDAQHKYNTLKEGIERVGQEMDIQYNPSDDKALVETILKEINNREQTALPQNQNAQLQNIISQFESLGINNFLVKRGLPPVSTSQVDQNLEEKVALYLTEFVSEHLALDKRVNELEQLLNIPASNPDQATPIINSIKKTSESVIIRVLKKILGPILVQPV